VAVHNFGSNRGRAVPLQTSLGWSRGIFTPQFDIGLIGNVTVRDDWVTGGGGVEVGWGWIEGWSVAGRAGARRPESSAQKPFSLGAGLVADRLVLDYAIELFDGGRNAHHLTLRWR
jgi:hypothetical protein